MSLVADQEIVSWTQNNLSMLHAEYERFVAQTNIQLPFDTFCKQAFWQMPYTAAQANTR